MAEIAGAAPPGDDPSQRAADVGRASQHFAQIGAQQRIFAEVLDEREPRGDRIHVGKRGGKVLGQLPRAGAGHAAVDRGDQAAGASALLRGKDLEACPGGLVHREPFVARARDRREQKRHAPAADMFEIGKQPAGRSKHRA